MPTETASLGGASMPVAVESANSTQSEQKSMSSPQQKQRSSSHASADNYKYILTGVTGRLGQAVLDAIQEHNLVSFDRLIISTSSNVNHQRWNDLKARGVIVRHGNYNNVQSLERAFEGGQKLLIISSPSIELDMPEKQYNEGRDGQHWNAILAARNAGIRHIYYTSMAIFPVNPFEAMASVMRSHERTERSLRLLTDTAYTIIREAPYAESWPLYLGYYNGPSELRHELIVAGDGPVSWTSLHDLALGTAMILTDACSTWYGVTVTLSSQLRVSLAQVATTVSRVRQYQTKTIVVTENEYVRHYTNQQKIGEDVLKWWASTYAALARGEAWHHDASTLRLLLQKVNKEPRHIDDIVEKMLTEEK